MIIGLSGKARAGKDTVGRFLVRNHTFEAIAFADPMKDFCKRIFKFSEEQLNGSLKETVDPRYPYLTPRRALQTLGTEWGRGCYQDVWVDYALREAYSRIRSYPISGVVITDVRFKNERDAIHQVGGKVWRIIREGSGLQGDVSQHASENELTDDMPYDRIIHNDNGSLDELSKIVSSIITGHT